MFYSRPKIEPLGWDLIDLPTPNGSKHFDALTSDGRPLDIRFGGGWISVEAGPKMAEILSVPISPFGTMDIAAEQICEILGLTVNGVKIDASRVPIGARGFDWSGRTTYWQSTHLMLPRDDPRTFVQSLCEAFPGSILVQPEWGSHGLLRCRQIKFLMASDEMVSLGVGPVRTRLHSMLSGQRISTEDFESTFDFRVDFTHSDGFGGDVTGSGFVHNHGAAELGIRYSVIQHRLYRIKVEYPTESAEAQARMQTLSILIGKSFRRGLEAVNLQTGAILAESLKDDYDARSYSIALFDEWRTGPGRYLWVGKTIPGDEFDGEGGVFYGVRPLPHA